MLAPQKTNLFRPCLFKRHSIFQALFSAGFVVFPGFACWRYAGFWSFWPLALVQQAPAAIFFVVLRSLGGAALFRSSCPSPNPSYRFWLLALTFRSSRPAFCGRLTSPVRNLWTIQPPASFFLGYRCFYGMGYQLSHLRILYSRMPLKIATLPLAFRLLFGRFFVSQLTYLGCWHTGLCIIHHFPRGTVSELV